MSLESDIVHCLTDDLRRAPYKGHRNTLRGHCYVASEALYHLRGGKAAGLKPMFISHEGAPHWFLTDTKNKIIYDLTARQFETPVPYHLAKGKGFLTAKPSARATKVMQRVQNQRDPNHQSRRIMQKSFRKGDQVQIFDDAADAYDKKYRNKTFVITHVATKYMPLGEFFAKGKPAGYHPGFDITSDSALYDLETLNGRPLPFSLYDWELSDV